MSVVGFSVFLPNHCIERRVVMEEKLCIENGIVEMVPGFCIIAPYVESRGVPSDHTKHECRCIYCNSGPTSTEQR